MTERQDDIKANQARNTEMLEASDRIKTRFNDQKTALDTESDGSGKDRNKDLTKRTKRELKADLDDTLLCMLYWEAEATDVRAKAKILDKEYNRRP